jgi:hypothetical protein
MCVLRDLTPSYTHLKTDTEDSRVKWEIRYLCNTDVKMWIDYNWTDSFYGRNIILPVSSWNINKQVSSKRSYYFQVMCERILGNETALRHLVYSNFGEKRRDKVTQLRYSGSVWGTFSVRTPAGTTHFRDFPQFLQKYAGIIRSHDYTARYYTLQITATHSRSRDSVVGIATSYGLDDREVGVRVPVGSRSFSRSSRPALRFTQPPISWVPGGSFPGG